MWGMSKRDLRGALVIPVAFVGLSFAAGAACGGVYRWLDAVPRPPGPAYNAIPPTTGTDVQLRVEAEFRYQGQDCVLVSVNTFPRGCKGELRCAWSQQASFVDCGHGLVLSNPR
jgi:hypothetical protein